MESRDRREPAEDMRILRPETFWVGRAFSLIAELASDGAHGEQGRSEIALISRHTNVPTHRLLASQMCQGET